MDKKMLKEIPVKEFNLGTTALSNIKLTYFINAYVRNKILILDIYDTSNELKYRIFQTKTEFITLEGNKWRESKLINLLTGYYYPTFVASKMSEKVIQKYLNTEDNALETLKSTQEGIRKAELDNKHKAELDWIDSYMKSVKEVPRDFEKWINDVALIKSRYIIYEYKSGKTMKGKCTHCQSDVMVNKPKHNLPGICPSCKSNIIYKAKGKANNIVDCCTAQLLQKHPSGLIVREFDITKRYLSSGGSSLSYFERNRSISGKENIDFAWDVYKQSGPLRWCKGYWNIDTGALYTKNLKRVLDGTAFQYSGLIEMGESKRSFSSTDYLRTYQNGPALEYLSKLKLYNLALSAIHNRFDKEAINLTGNNPLEVLKLSKNGLNRAIKYNVTHSELRLLQTSEKEGVHVPDEVFKDVAEDFSYYYKDLIRLSKLSTLNQLLKYIKLKKVNFGDYRDYISMATKLNWNITDSFILFPRHFKQAHDQAQSLVKVKESYAENLIIKKMYEDLNKQLSFSSEDYSIRLPMSAKEIIREGHELHHCVGNYIQSVAKGKTLILLIRKKANPFSPYYTLELDPKEKSIRQVRGKSNCNPDDDITKLLENYKKNLNKIKVNIAC